MVNYGTKRTTKFSGKQYIIEATYNTLRGAKEGANHLRHRGFCARVKPFKFDGKGKNTLYALYVRFKKGGETRARM